MKDLTVRRLRGPNRHSRMSVVEIRVNCENCPTVTRERLRDRLQVLPKTGSWAGIRRLIEKLPDSNASTPVGFLLAALTSSMEEDRFPRGPRQVWSKPPDDDDRILAVVETGDVDVTGHAAVLAFEICNFVLTTGRVPGSTVEILDGKMRQFVSARNSLRFNYITHMLAAAARGLDIPTAKFLPNRPFLVLGQGRHRTRLFECSGDPTGHLAVSLSNDKILFHEVMIRHHLPVPAQRLVSTDAEIDAAVKAIGPPLVVKGRTSDKGISVTANITTKSELRRAVEKVRKLGDQVIVQRHLEGNDFRITLACGEMVAAAMRIPAQVVGDGKQTVTELIRAENQRRNESGFFARWYVQLKTDAETEAMLAQAGLTLTSVPDANEIIRLRSAQNLSQGGTAIDVTDDIHPDIVRVVERAVRSIGLSLAGVDVITTDITRPLHETGGAIIEINSHPGLRPHYLTPTPRDVARDIVDRLLPGEHRGRIPTIGVTGTNGKTTTCRMLEVIAKQQGYLVGSCTSAGITVGDDAVATGDYAGGSGVRTVLDDTRTEFGVFELARGGILKRGLNIDDLDVAVVTNVADDHLGEDGIHTIAELARIKRVLVEVARQGVVLNADDEQCVAMAEHASAPVWWVSAFPDNALIKKHVAAGGDAIVLAHDNGRDNGRDCLVHLSGESSSVVIPVDDIPSTLQGHALHNVYNAMCAAAAALAQGIPASSVQAALAAFTIDPESSPGRLNIRDVDGVRLIYDWVHNAHGMNAMAAMIRSMGIRGRKLCVLSHHGRRIDAFYPEYAASAAPHFDKFIIGENPRENSREQGELSQLLRTGLFNGGASEAQVIVGGTLEESIFLAYKELEAGDLLLITGGFREPTWEYLDRFQAGDG